MSSFFNTNSYFIDEKVNMFEFANAYNIYNDKGGKTGTVKQKLSTGDKLLRLVLNKKMLPFCLEIRNAGDELEATINRGWTFWLSKISITNAGGKVVGIVKQEFTLLSPSFRILKDNNETLAEISGDWKAWNFKIKDASKKEIATVTKKWAGVMKELFTTADKYNLTFDPSYTDQDNKIAILSAAVTIDMVLKERE